MIGQHIRNYKITEHLGEGGMGTVFKASDDVLGRDVALKMLHAPLLKQPQFLERFKKEARVLAQLLHPNIAIIYNFIEQDDNHFMVMEYVQGKNLESATKQNGTLHYKIIAAIFYQALEGLAHAHKKGILHRDIKPANLILSPEGVVKLMDFGIAIMAGEQRLTQVNRIVGTVEFMAPELIQGKEPSPASDIYATGVTMYELLTGKLPFESNTDYNLMQDILKKKPFPIERLNANVPKGLALIVMKAMEKNPAHRHPDAKAFQQALINVFPDLKDLDLTKALHTEVVATKVIKLSTKPDEILVSTKLAVNSTSPGIKLQDLLVSVKAGIKKEKKKLSLVFPIVLALIIASAVIYFSGKAAPENVAAGNKKPPKKDSLNDSGREVNAILPIVNTEPAISTEIAAEKGEPTKDEEEKDRKEKETKVPVQKMSKQDVAVKEPIKNEPKKDIVIELPPADEKKEEPKPEVKYAAKSLKLQSRIEVDLYLVQSINPATAQAGQSLQFSVSSAIQYDGETIIESGAIANGRIKSMGNKKMSILFINVMARNGQYVPFAEIELSGRIDEMLRSRNYSALLKRGTIINF